MQDKRYCSDSSEMKEQILLKKPLENITGVILAGGLSSRYGKDKAFLMINGTPLIERTAEKMKKIFQEVILISNEKKRLSYLGLPVFEDIKKGLGPLGGIYTGLLSMSNEMGFFIACDMPFIDEGLVRYMTDIRDNYWAVVPSVGNEIEPLHAVYSKSCLSAIENLIKANTYQVRLFYGHINIKYVKEDEIKKFTSPEQVFLNINTPDEYSRIGRLIKKQNVRG